MSSGSSLYTNWILCTNHHSDGHVLTDFSHAFDNNDDGDYFINHDDNNDVDEDLDDDDDDEADNLANAAMAASRSPISGNSLSPPINLRLVIVIVTARIVINIITNHHAHCHRCHHHHYQTHSKD